jgi:hypothetical protein
MLHVSLVLDHLQTLKNIAVQLGFKLHTLVPEDGRGGPNIQHLVCLTTVYKLLLISYSTMRLITSK